MQANLKMYLSDNVFVWLTMLVHTHLHSACRKPPHSNASVWESEIAKAGSSQKNFLGCKGLSCVLTTFIHTIEFQGWMYFKNKIQIINMFHPCCTSQCFHVYAWNCVYLKKGSAPTHTPSSWVLGLWLLMSWFWLSFFKAISFTGAPNLHTQGQEDRTKRRRPNSR